MSILYDQLVAGAQRALVTARDRATSVESYTEIASVFAELAKAEAVMTQAVAMQSVSQEIARLASAVQQRR